MLKIPLLSLNPKEHWQVLRVLNEQLALLLGYVATMAL